MIFKHPSQSKSFYNSQNSAAGTLHRALKNSKIHSLRFQNEAMILNDFNTYIIIYYFLDLLNAKIKHCQIKNTYFVIYEPCTK